MTNQQISDLAEGLTGVYRIGAKYYIFTVSYHYIGTVESVTREHIIIANDAQIVMAAGDANDSVSNIVQGKAKPQVSETPHRRIIIERHAIVSAIEWEKN